MNCLACIVVVNIAQQSENIVNIYVIYYLLLDSILNKVFAQKSKA